MENECGVPGKLVYEYYYSNEIYGLVLKTGIMCPIYEIYNLSTADYGFKYNFYYSYTTDNFTEAINLAESFT